MTTTTDAKKKINVLHLRSCRGVGGGPEKTILFSAREVDREAFELNIAYLKSRDDKDFDLDQRAKKLGIENFVTIEETKKLDIAALKKLLQLLREKQIDVLSCHCYKSDLYGLILSRYHKMKLITTAHGPLASFKFFWSAQNWRVRYLYDQMDLRLMKRFDHVMIVSDSMRETILRYGVKNEKITWVKNAIDSQFFRRTGDRSLRDRAEIPRDAVVIGAVGRLNAEKDYPNFMEMARILLQKRPDLYFVIAGGGALEEALKKQAEGLGLTQRLRFMGHFQDVRQVYDMLDFYVLSSTREGLPNTVLEAMAMEVPIVATDVDGVSEASSHNEDGLLVPPRDPHALAASVQTLLDNPQLAKKLTEHARAKIEREFSFATRMRHVESIYRKVMSPEKVPV